MIVNQKQTNSDLPQACFLKRQKVLKADGMSPFMPQDLMVGCDLGIQGRSIRVTDADEYTRKFFADLNMPQAEAQTIPGDALQQSLVKVARPPDNESKEYTEKTLGGGKVASQK